MTVRTLHGANIKVMFGATVVGRCTGLSPTQNWAQQGIYGIGELKPIEISTLRWDGGFTFSRLIVEKDKAFDVVATEALDGKSTKSLEQKIRAILESDGFDIVVATKKDDVTIVKLTGCKIASETWTFAELAVAVHNGNGVCLDVE